MEEEEEINRMVRVLLSGGKMLSKRCEKCGAPMFELKGKELCVACHGRERSGLEVVSDKLLSKAIEISEKIEGEEDPKKIITDLEVLKEILELIKHLREMGVR